MYHINLIDLRDFGDMKQNEKNIGNLLEPGGDVEEDQQRFMHRSMNE
jgi:hypothetical protein